MVDVDRYYQLLILRLRPNADDPFELADSLMPTLLATFTTIWEEGRDHGRLERDHGLLEDHFELEGNPYGPEHWPDWPRRSPSS